MATGMNRCRVCGAFPNFISDNQRVFCSNRKCRHSKIFVLWQEWNAQNDVTGNDEIDTQKQPDNQ